jgi:hypothetical protein
MARISFGIAVGIAAGFAISFGLAAMVMMLANDDSLADFDD